jgi:hypothetical protein
MSILNPCSNGGRIIPASFLECLFSSVLPRAKDPVIVFDEEELLCLCWKHIADERFEHKL